MKCLRNGSGELSNSGHVPKNATRPSCKKITRSASFFARCVSCVTTMEVLCSVCFNFKISVAGVRCHQRIHHRRRLVVKNRVGIFRQRPRNRDRRASFPCSGRTAAAPRNRKLRASRAIPPRACRSRPSLSRLAAFHRKRHVFRHRQRIEKRARLKHHRHAPANFRKLPLGPFGNVLRPPR